MSGLATPLQCNFTFNTHLFANLAAVYEAASSQELMARVLNTMDQQHYTDQQQFTSRFVVTIYWKFCRVFQFIFEFAQVEGYQTTCSIAVKLTKRRLAQRTGVQSRDLVLLWGPLRT